MRYFLIASMVATVAITLAGCAGSNAAGPSCCSRTGSASGPTSASSTRLLCETCDYGFVSEDKRAVPRAFCSDGKTIFDCSKNPPECPECAKNASK